MPTFSGKNDSGEIPLTLDRLRRSGLGAVFRPGKLEAAGISYDQLRSLVRSGKIERIARGLYHLTDSEPTERHHLAAVCARVPNSIVCLLSALQFHSIGTQLPREIWLAIPHKARPPRLPGFKTRLLRFSGASWRYGILDVEFEGVPGKVTNPARTVVDCFRFERLIGREAAMEALREALRQRKVTADALYRILGVLPCRRLVSILEATAP
ncbi:MAG: AbiEi antitoxin N-terminal domain-containing protein [Planctomycetes bacterium]|nr:AbiEi antitoxin N-terminal domain-containing protein [Planctomycetota bacterium]